MFNKSQIFKFKIREKEFINKNIKVKSRYYADNNINQNNNLDKLKH